jgi:hypothetical protein
MIHNNIFSYNQLREYDFAISNDDGIVAIVSRYISCICGLSVCHPFEGGLVVFVLQTQWVFVLQAQEGFVRKRLHSGEWDYLHHLPQDLELQERSLLVWLRVELSPEQMEMTKHLLLLSVD